VNGIEQTAVWLVGLLLGSVSVRILTDAWVAVAKVQAGVLLHVPADWSKDGER
jgi:hypothetical protein